LRPERSFIVDDRERLDQALVARGLALSRQRAVAIIKVGGATVNGQVVTKPAHLCAESDRLEARDPLAFVGRGGLKLEAALDAFGVDPMGKLCLDVGASTGGFTDCLLQRGARMVVAVDVGRGQLSDTLRQDSRVTILEQTDIRVLTPEAFGVPAQLAVCDVSFISLALVLPAIHDLLWSGGEAVVLIKPQFEVGPHRVGKGGIVKDAKARLEAIEKVIFAAKLIGFTVLDIITSPVTGGDGNREYLLHLFSGETLHDPTRLSARIKEAL